MHHSKVVSHQFNSSKNTQRRHCWAPVPSIICTLCACKGRVPLVDPSIILVQWYIVVIRIVCLKLKSFSDSGCNVNLEHVVSNNKSVCHIHVMNQIEIIQLCKQNSIHIDFRKSANLLKFQSLERSQLLFILNSEICRIPPIL